MKCDVVKPRKPAMDTRPPPVKGPQQEKPQRSEPKFAAVKIGMFFFFLLQSIQTNLSFLSPSASGAVN